MIEAKKSEIARLPKPGSFFFVKERTMTDDKNKFHTSASTRSVHVGERRHKPYHSLIDPIVPTSTYIFDSYEDICQFTQIRITPSPLTAWNMVAMVIQRLELSKSVWQPWRVVRKPCWKAPGRQRK